MPITATTTLGEIVTEDARRTRVLEGFGLDYCCDGAQLLGDAVRAAGLDLGAVTAALDLPADSAPVSQTPGDAATLAHDIIDTHHAYMWQEIPRLAELVEKIYRVHGERHPELGRVRELYVRLVAELDPHMTREERSVFPAISKLEKGGAAAGDLGAAIDRLVDEHQVVGDLFKELNAVTGGYQVPADGCTSYRMTYEGLAEMEHDLHVHIHKENNILFPAARKLAP